MRWTEELAADFQSRDGMGEEGVYDFEEFNWEEVSSCEVGNCTEVRGCYRGETCEARELYNSCAQDTRDVWECPGCNECVLHAFEHRRWMRVVANSIKPANYHEQQDFVKPFAKAFWEKSVEWGKRAGGYRRGHMVFKQIVARTDVDSWVCSSCAMAMLFRPKTRLKFWRDFFSSPVAQAKTLVTFAARTGYAEAAVCFPDDTPMSEACVDETLRHPPCAEYIKQWHIKLKAPNGDRTGYLLVSDGMKILKVRRAGARLILFPIKSALHYFFNSHIFESDCFPNPLYT